MTIMGSNGRATADERFAAFVDAVAANLLPVALSPNDVKAFYGGVRSTNLGTVQLARVRVASDVAVSRTHRLIQRSAPEYLKVAVQVAGSCLVSQGDREAVLNPGDYVIYDTTRPYQLRTRGSFQMQTVMFPRSLLQLSRWQLSQVTARRISGHEGLGFMVSSFIVELGKRSPGGLRSANTHLADAVLDVLAASYAEQLLDAAPRDPSTGRKGLLLRVRVFIEGRLGDHSLDLTTIAAAHHISVRYLQKLFEEEGQTVTGWVRDRRIEHCRKDLANPAFADTAVSSIAARRGLVNAAHFSRLFKARLGVSPSEYRERALNGGWEPAHRSAACGSDRLVD